MLAMNASQQRGQWGWEHGERIQILIGLLPITAAGAIAGGAGAAVGNNRRKRGIALADDAPTNK
jgi:hypothetical protein